MSELTGILLNERYRLDAEIGRGGMGVVYRAYDSLLQRDVAVKVLSEATLGSESRARLLREAQATAQLNHPNIASVHDAGESELPSHAGTVPFIVMELVAGQSLHDRPPAGLEETVDIAGQVCAALEHAHAHEIVHRDLKPENVLLAAGGQAKLVDFGLARTVTSRLTTEGTIVGTLLYLAPEQAQGAELDGRADLYALGVMLYEWAAGRLPFVGDDPLAVIGQHLHAPVVPPREHNPEIPPALDALIVQLLSKRAEDRPPSAEEVRQALLAAEPPRVQVLLPGFLREEAGQEVDQQPAFVARERELAWLDGFLEEALDGRGQVLFVTGGPGRGKTALLEAFARQAMDEHPELLVAGGTCNAYSGVGDPYLPFREALAMLSGDVEARWAAGAVSGDQARRLWQALPVTVAALLAHGPHMVPALVPGQTLLYRAETACPRAPWLGRLRERVERGESGAGRLEQSHLFQQVSNVLHALAEKHPLLLILDDLQWVDRTSAGLLFHLGRRLEGARILIAGAYRPEEVTPGVEDPRTGQRHPLERVLAEFKGAYGDVWLDLAEVETREERRFVEALLATEPNRLGESFRQTLADRAEGHPLFTVELLRAMQERGDLVRDRAGRWIEGPALDWEAMPARVEGVIAARIERLEGELRDILTVASVEGEDFTAEVVGQVRSMEARELVRRLSGELQKEHRLVRSQGLRRLEARRLALYRFQHHLFQKYLYNYLDEAERAYLHEDVGTVLEALYGEQADEVAVQLARHFLEAGVRDKAAHYLGRAGVRAAAQYANEEAVDHLSRALELAPDMDQAERYRLLLCRTEVYHLTGRRDEQRQDLTELTALSEVLGAERQAEVASQMARLAHSTGDFSAAIAAAQTVIDRAQASGNGELQAKGHLQWSKSLGSQAYDRAGIQQAEKALTLARAAGLPNVEAGALLELGWGYYAEDDLDRSAEHVEQALHLFRQTGDRRGEMRTFNYFGLLSFSRGDYGRARSCYEHSLRLARELGDRRGEVYGLAGQGDFFDTIGAYGRARGYFEQALAVALEVQDTNLEGQITYELGEMALCEGDLAGARGYFERTLHLARTLDHVETEACALDGYGWLHLDLDEPDAARDYCAQALRLFRQSEYQSATMRSLAGCASAALRQGDLNQALACMAEILAYLDGGGGFDIISWPLRIYLTCYQVLDAVGDPRARTFLGQTYELLMEQADRIDDEYMRRSFLENVAWHREIVELARGLDRTGVDGNAPA